MPTSNIVIDKPFPHLVIRDVFDADEYRQLDENWPSLELFTTSESGLKHDLREDSYDSLHDSWKDIIPEFIDGLGMLCAEAFQVQNPGAANKGRFMVREGGYVLEPHLDASHYTVTCLLYFPTPEQSDGCGTRLYAPHYPLLEKSGRTQYFWKQGISCPMVKQIPFTPNTLFAFANGPTAAHGLVVPAGERRRVFQFHMSHKLAEL